jgi:putative DNA primase/helicase
MKSLSELTDKLNAKHREDFQKRKAADANGGSNVTSINVPGDTGVVNVYVHEERPPEYSDSALASEFVERYENDLRYVNAWADWFNWTGTHWKREQTSLAFHLARKVCDDAAARLHNSKPGNSSSVASAKTIAAVERIAKTDRAIASTTDQWDADPLLLNTPNGTIELRTGKMRNNRQDDYITKITAVAPGGDCPMFKEFLDRITDGDRGLQRYLQRIFGYSLTGLTQEQAMFFFFGKGANGKSVLLSTISGILRDYTTAAPMETFTATRSDRHPTELAKMRGARLVTSVETEEGRQWAESRIKALTGGDIISARFMRGDFFDYVPSFKLVIAGNHKPGLKTVDEAMRRRFNLVPFTVTIPEDERDPELQKKLEDEWPGILQWIVDGCIEWQELGTLATPQSVKDATAEYLEGEDSVAAWLAECCEVHAAKVDTSTALYESWKNWASEAGEIPGSQKKFSQKLQERGFQKDHGNRGTKFSGVAVISKLLRGEK